MSRRKLGRSGGKGISKKLPARASGITIQEAADIKGKP